MPGGGREAQALTQDHSCGLKCCFPFLLPKLTNHVSITSKDLHSTGRPAIRM